MQVIRHMKDPAILKDPFLQDLTLCTDFKLDLMKCSSFQSFSNVFYWTVVQISAEELGSVWRAFAGTKIV